jgi:phosphoribosyl 1,2-cyclic phosphodiesterase
MTHDDKLTIRFRGVRGSIPAPAPENMRYGGNTSCVEVRYHDQLLILDAGSGIRSLGDELVRSAQGNPIEATLLLSHSHWDHIQGLPFFTPAYSPSNRIAIFGESGRAEQLQHALETQMAPAHFPVGLQQMRGLLPVRELSREATKFGGLLVRATRLNHPGGCTGFRIECAAGHVAYLPDHEPSRNNGAENGNVESARRELVEFIRGVDLLILDTQYTADEYTRRIGWGHGCLPDSVDLAAEAGVRRLLFFHHDPSHDDRQIDEMVEVARAMTFRSPLSVDAASEHEIVSVGSSNIEAVTTNGFSPVQEIIASIAPLSRPETPVHSA